MQKRKVKPRKCKSCRGDFYPSNNMQLVCSPACAFALVDKKKDVDAVKSKRLDRARQRQDKERIKTLAQLLKEAEAVVNKYVRLRDYHLGCCSCDKPAEWSGQWHASHYRSVGSSPQLRFNLWNIHKGCSQCNNYLSGNIGEYRIRLIKRFGIDRVEWIEHQNDIRRYTPEYARRIKAIFSKRCRMIEKRLGLR